MKRPEGNLISFKVLVTKTGSVVTELSGVPQQDLNKIFNGGELQLMRSLIRLSREKLEPLHDHLEAELDALNHPTT